MSSKKKNGKLLLWLIVILMVGLIGKTISWFTWERDAREEQEYLQNIRAEKPQVQKMEKKTPVPGIRERSFSLKVNRYLNDETTVQYLIPVDESGRPKPGASNIVFYAPYNGDAPLIRRGLKPWHRYFAEQLGFTIFSLTINTSLEAAMNREKYYIFKEAGWHEIFFEIQKRIEKENHLAHRPLLIVGESSGSSMAEMMSALYPDRVAAAAWCGGATYEPIGKDNPGAWLAMNTWGCYGISPTREFQKQAEGQGRQVLRAETAPNGKAITGKYFHHAASEMSYRLMQIFIRDMVNLRDRNGGKIPPVEQWPVCREQNGKKLYFPSEEFAALWEQVPHEVNRQQAEAEGPVMAVFPPKGPVDRIVIFAEKEETEGNLLSQDSLYELSQKKVLPISFKVGDDCVQDFDRLKQALAEVLARKEWSDLPVYVVGRGVGGQILASVALENGNRRIARIVTFNSEYEYPFEQLSIAEHRRASNLPLRMYFDKAKLAPGMNAVPHTEVILVGADEFQTEKWFARLNESVR